MLGMPRLTRHRSTRARCITTPPFIVSHMALCSGRARHRDGEIRRRGGAAPDRGQSGAMGQLRADHDASDQNACNRAYAIAYDLSSPRRSCFLSAPMPPWLKEKWIAWLGPERIYELYGGTERQGATVISGVECSRTQGRWSRAKIGKNFGASRIISEDGSNCRARRDRRNLFPAQRRRRQHLSLSRRRAEDAVPTAGNRSATSAGSTPTAISISAIGSPT